MAAIVWLVKEEAANDWQQWRAPVKYWNASTSTLRHRRWQSMRQYACAVAFQKFCSRNVFNLSTDEQSWRDRRLTGPKVACRATCRCLDGALTDVVKVTADWRVIGWIGGHVTNRCTCDPALARAGHHAYSIHRAIWRGLIQGKCNRR